MNQVEPRLGRVSYINMEPIYMGLARGSAPYDPVARVPTELNRLLAAGELDCAPCSAIEYANQAGQYLVMPEVCVASDGEVGSALLLSRVPVNQLDGERVAVTTDSATTAALLRVLAADHWQIKPEFVPADPDDALSPRYAAALLIGDPALRAVAGPSTGLVLDLGTAWKELTGLPMVFALWLVRREFAAANPETTARLASWLKTALDWASDPKALREVTVAAARRTGLSEESVGNYFRLQRYALGDEYRAGYAEFLRRCAAHGLIPAAPAVEYFEPASVGAR